jgi:hypothetical protein
MKQPQNIEDLKKEIVHQIGDLSRILGMIPGDDTITVSDPVTQDSMPLSKWLSDARDSFLKLSILTGQALDINLY